MNLNKQIYLYSVKTDIFYTEEEEDINRKLLRLYNIRKKYKNKKKVNLLIKKQKNKLKELLNKNKNIRSLNIDKLNKKDIITLFESSLTRSLNIKTNDLTKKILVVRVYFFQVFKNLVEDGFMWNNEKYIFLTASAGQIRTKKAVFIQENEYLKIQQQLMCGLTIEEINEKGGINPNKFLSYLALSGSATEVWKNFDIEKSIVVDDFETFVEGEVDYINDTTYEITRKRMKIPICHTDGCGIMLDQPTKMVRLPWLKGILCYFPFDQFIKEYCPGGECIVTDIYGEEHKIIEEGIRYIFTKSQFKLHNFFLSWSCYKARFIGNNCEACFCNEEEDYIPNSRINYQMLQTLSDMTDKEIQYLTRNTIKEIDSIGNDYQSTMRLLGATEYNKNPSYFQEALMIYPELFKDKYCREILKQTKKSLVKQAKSGRLRVNGGYRFLSPDLYAFCEWLFLQIPNPKGLLKNGEVYVKKYQNNDELACLRSPHLYREWPIRINKKDNELNKWFGETECIYTSCQDLITKIVQADVDGDRLLVIKDKLLTTIAKRNMKDVVPLYYEMKKAKPQIINNYILYKGMEIAYRTGNIGPKSNLITIVHNNDEENREEALDVVKWLTMEVNFTIDGSKTLYFIKRPKEIDKIIKKHTKSKLPNFFIYAKDKKSNQVEPPNNSTMNRIAKQIPSSRIKFNKSIAKFNYKMLMNNNYNYTISENNIVIDRYKYWNSRQCLFNYQDNNVKDQDLYKYKEIKDKIIKESEGKIDYIVNVLVEYLYKFCPNSNKKTLWACFGDVMLNNLKNNLEGKGKICKICGKRFYPNSKAPHSLCCSKECSKELKKIKDREYNASVRKK